MSSEAIPPPLRARLRDGSPYTGNQQYAGQGMKKSCGKCLQHRLQQAGQGRVTKRWGWMCKECVEGA